MRGRCRLHACRWITCAETAPDSAYLCVFMHVCVRLGRKEKEGGKGKKKLSSLKRVILKDRQTRLGLEGTTAIETVDCNAIEEEVCGNAVTVTIPLNTSAMP